MGCLVVADIITSLLRALKILRLPTRCQRFARLKAFEITADRSVDISSDQE